MFKLEQKYLTLINLAKEQKQNHAQNMAICLQVLSTANKIDKICAEKLAQYSLSEGRFLILALLMHHQQLSPLEIAHYSGVTKATISSLLQSLTHDQLVSKAADLQDGRKQIITLTETGKQLIEQLFTIHTQWIEQLTQHFTPQESEQLTSLLTKLITNLNQP